MSERLKPLHDSARSSAPGMPSDKLLELPYKEARRQVLDDFEAHYLKHLLERSEGNVASAARGAGMDRTYLIKLLQRHGLR